MPLQVLVQEFPETKSNPSARPLIVSVSLSSCGGRKPSGILAGRFRCSQKNGFDWLLEQSRNVEGEWQAWIVLPALNGIHGLPRHSEVRGEVRLRPITLGAQNAKSVFHLSSYLARNRSGTWPNAISPANCSVVELPTKRWSPTSTTGTDLIPFIMIVCGLRVTSNIFKLKPISFCKACSRARTMGQNGQLKKV